VGFVRFVGLPLLYYSLPFQFGMSAKVHQQPEPVAGRVQIIQDLRAVLISQR
jgi:hypothetical protein